MPFVGFGMPRCETRDELAADVQRVLTDLVQLAHREIEAVKIGAQNTIAAIDKLIENTFGRKERAMGALVQHRREHGC